MFFDRWLSAFKRKWGAVGQRQREAIRELKGACTPHWRQKLSPWLTNGTYYSTLHSVQHKRIFVVGGPHTNSQRQEAEADFRSFMAEMGLECELTPYLIEGAIEIAFIFQEGVIESSPEEVSEHIALAGECFVAHFTLGLYTEEQLWEFLNDPMLLAPHVIRIQCGLSEADKIKAARLTVLTLLNKRA